MPDVTQLVQARGGVAPGQRNLVVGKVSKSKAAPTSGSDLLYVVLPDFSPDHSEPARWTPIAGWSLPAQDADVLVGFDDTREPYALWWSGTPSLVTATVPRASIALGVSTSSSPTATEIDAFNALISPRQADLVHLFGTYEDTAWASPLAMLASKNITPVIALHSETLPAHAILDGSWDTQLVASATAFKNFGRTLIVRPWHEMNLGGTRNAYGHGSKGGSSGDTYDQFKEAWRYIFDLWRDPELSGGACTNVLAAWNVNQFNIAGGGDILDPEPYYPGDAYVDIIGSDAYTSVVDPEEEQTFRGVFLDNDNYSRLTALAPSKPFVIFETAVAERADVDERQWIRDIPFNEMPALAAIMWWNRNDSPNDFRIDAGGANLQKRNVFRDMVNGPPFTSLARNQTARKQVTAVPYAATLTVDCGQGDTFTTTLTGAVIIGAPSGTPFNGQRLVYLFKQDPTGSRVISSWNSVFRFPADLPSPTLTTTASKSDRVGFEYNAADSKWDCVQIVKGF